MFALISQARSMRCAKRSERVRCSRKSRRSSCDWSEAMWKPKPGFRTRRVAVVGSGFGGLAVAIRLQTAGFETTLFERDVQPGGRARVFRQDGFTFDAGPTVITAPQCLEELFTQAGRSLHDYVTLVP